MLGALMGMAGVDEQQLAVVRDRVVEFWASWVDFYNTRLPELETRLATLEDVVAASLEDVHGAADAPGGDAE